MQELTPDAFATAPALAGVGINHVMARAVVEACLPGRLWVENGDAPACAHALHPYNMSLVWGAGVERALPALGRHLREGRYRQADEWLQIDPVWNGIDWDGLLQPKARYTRVNFRFDASAFRARFDGADPPKGWNIRPMRAAEFDPPGIVVTPRAFWRHAAHFLANGGGICAEKDGAVGAFAFSAFRFDSELEIGIETYPDHRGQGLAQACAAALIRHCLAQGITPVWSCRKENTASYRLARKLGFVASLELPFYQLAAATDLPRPA